MAIDLSDLEVTLETHWGHQASSVGVVKVDLGQYYVRANGVHVGYIAKHNQGNVMFLNMEIPAQVKDAIKEKVDVILGRVTSAHVNGAPILDEAFEEDDDDDLE